jgi:hypothetical protein
MDFDHLLSVRTAQTTVGKCPEAFLDRRSITGGVSGDVLANGPVGSLGARPCFIVADIAQTSIDRMMRDLLGKIGTNHFYERRRACRNNRRCLAGCPRAVLPETNTKPPSPGKQLQSWC